MSATILHITDTHLYASKDQAHHLSGVKPYAALEAVLQTAKQHYKDANASPDLILHTGDITQDHLPESYRHVAELILKYFPNHRNRIACVEGNHAERVNFEQVFRDEFGFSIASSEGCVVVDVKKQKSATTDDDDAEAAWEVILVPTHSPLNVYGHILETDLKFLENRFLARDDDDNASSSSSTTRRQRGDDESSDNKHAIIAMHHPPFHPQFLAAAGSNSWAEACFRDGDAHNNARRRLRDLIWGSKTRDESLKMLLHGHLHMDLAMTREKDASTHETTQAAAIATLKAHHDEEKSSGHHSTTKQAEKEMIARQETEETNLLNQMYVPATTNSFSSSVVQLCSPATLHQHDGSVSWSDPPIVKHGCRVLTLQENGSFDSVVLHANETFTI